MCDLPRIDQLDPVLLYRRESTILGGVGGVLDLGGRRVRGAEHDLAFFHHVVAENRVVDYLPVGVLGAIVAEPLLPLVFDVLLDLLFGHSDPVEFDVFVGFGDLFSFPDDDAVTHVVLTEVLVLVRVELTEVLAAVL